MSHDDYPYPDESDHDAFDDDSGDADETELERLCREALVQLEDGDPDAARELASEAVAYDPDHPFPLFVLAVIAEQEGDLAAARYLSDKALQSASTNPDAIQLRAQLHVREFEFDEAERLLRFGIVHNPDDAELHETLARLCLARGRMAEAAQEAGASIRIDPGNAGAIAVRAAALEHGGDRDSMLAVLRQAVQLHPDDPYSIVELAAIEAEHGNLPRARALLARAHRLAPREPHVRDVRRVIEGAHAPTLLRPLPSLLAWLHEFPGGLVGFLLAFLVASLPLHALGTTHEAYAVPAWALLGAWAAVACYAWLGPAVLATRLNAFAARVARQHVHDHLDEVRRARNDGLPAIPLDLERVADAVSLSIGGRSYGAARTLLADARDVAPAQMEAELAQLEDQLGQPGRRVWAVIARLPADTRVLIALAVAVVIAAPEVSARVAVEPLQVQGLAAGLAVVAWLLARTEVRLLRTVDEWGRRQRERRSGERPRGAAAAG